MLLLCCIQSMCWNVVGDKWIQNSVTYAGIGVLHQTILHWLGRCVFLLQPVQSPHCICNLLQRGTKWTGRIPDHLRVVQDHHNPQLKGNGKERRKKTVINFPLINEWLVLTDTYRSGKWPHPCVLTHPCGISNEPVTRKTAVSSRVPVLLTSGGHYAIVGWFKSTAVWSCIVKHKSCVVNIKTVLL